MMLTENEVRELMQDDVTFTEEQVNAVELSPSEIAKAIMDAKENKLKASVSAKELLERREAELTAKLAAANTPSPGPWRIIDARGPEGNILFYSIYPAIGPNDEWKPCIANTVSVGEDYPNIGNARLIAAAPDLLAALNGLLNEHVALVGSGDCGSWDYEKDDCIVAARAAIKKATEGMPS